MVPIEPIHTWGDFYFIHSLGIVVTDDLVVASAPAGSPLCVSDRIESVVHRAANLENLAHAFEDPLQGYMSHYKVFMRILTNWRASWGKNSLFLVVHPGKGRKASSYQGLRGDDLIISFDMAGNINVPSRNHFPLPPEPSSNALQLTHVVPLSRVLTFKNGDMKKYFFDLGARHYHHGSYHWFQTHYPLFHTFDGHYLFDVLDLAYTYVNKTAKRFRHFHFVNAAAWVHGRGSWFGD